MAHEILTAARLRELLNYDPETGAFVNLTNRGKKTVVGRIAGSRNRRGYLIICLDYVRYRAHRLAWLYMTGEWPTHEVDHINGDGLDNRFVNLRDVTKALNLQNQRAASRNSKSGYLGVSKDRKRWAARIDVDGTKKHLGTFDTPEAAHAAYLDAKRRLHPGNML